MSRDRAFALTAITTLALCIAALSTVLAIVDAYYFKRLPVDRPDEIVAVAATRRHANQLGPVSFPDFVRFRDNTRTLKELAAHYSTAPLYVHVGEQGKEINGAVVTANFFPLLGLEPALGRFFTEGEDTVPNRDHVVVISHDFWRTAFGSRSDVLGTTFTVNRVPFTVIGVAPAHFRGVDTQPVEIYLPMMSLGVGYRWCTDAFAPDCTILEMIGRLAPGRRLQDAAAEMPTLMPPAWQTAADGENRNVTVFAPRTVHHDPAEQRFVALITGVAILLILVGCANIAGLLMARGTARVPELAMRASLGASPRRLLGQLMTEASALALCGGALGTVLSWWMMQAIAARFYSVGSEGHVMDFGFRLQWGVIAGAMAAALGAGLGFGLFPALNAIRQGAAASIPRASARTPGSRRIGLYLTGVQTSAAVVLISLGLLLSVSAERAVAGANFDSSNVALMRLRPRLVQYPPARAQAFHRDVLRRLEGLPGVQSASLIGQGVALFGGGAGVGLPGQAADDSVRARFGDIAPRYFETLRIPIIAGRDFDERDSADRPRVAIVSQALARRLFGDAHAVDQTILVDGRPHSVVGIAADVSVQARSEPAPPFVYTPFWQRADAIDARYCIRVIGDVDSALFTIVRAANAVDPEVPVAETIPLTVQMAGVFRPVRITAAFVGYAATLTIVLTAVGLYGALAFAVSRRRQEIGLRVALGATLRQVVAGIVGDGMRVVSIGVAGGVVLALGAVQLVQHLLLDLPLADGFFFVTSAASVIGIALLACWLPARRAARIDPVVALRCE